MAWGYNNYGQLGIGNTTNSNNPIQVSCSTLNVIDIGIINNGYTIFPTPTNNFITIQNNSNISEKFQFKIIDLIGRIVKNGETKFNEEINVENLATGNYNIQIETQNGKIYFEKLIKN